MRIVVALTLLGTLFLIGCDNKNLNVNGSNTNGNANTSPIVKPPEPLKSTSAVDPNFKPCNPYYPLVPGSQLKYTMNTSSGLVSDVTVVVDAEEQSGQKVFVEKTQIVDKSGGMSLLQHGTRKFVCDGGRLQILSDFTDNKVDGKPNTSDQKLRSPAIFMAEPAALAKPGSKWSYTFNITFQKPGEPTETLPESTTRNFEAQGTETIKVPAGEFKALKVAWRVNQAQGADYYVPGIGLVKRESGEGTSWVLKEYSGVRPAE